MLFGPKNSEQFGDSGADRGKPVEAGVAGGAHSDQQVGIAIAGMPVVHVEAVPRPAAGASEFIPVEDGVPISGKVIFRMSAGAVTPQAQTRDRREPFAAGAKERFLPESRLRPGPHGPFSTGAEG